MLVKMLETTEVWLWLLLVLQSLWGARLASVETLSHGRISHRLVSVASSRVIGRSLRQSLVELLLKLMGPKGALR